VRQYLCVTESGPMKQSARYIVGQARRPDQTGGLLNVFYPAPIIPIAPRAGCVIQSPGETMSESQKLMKQALGEIVLPVLRKSGFSGSLPHLRRHRSDLVDLISFQFDMHGGGFVIEIGQCDPKGFTTNWGKEIPAEKMNVSYLHPDFRPRIQAQPGSGTDSWFRYDRPEDSYPRTASSVLPFLRDLDAQYDALPKPKN
jgi:hypothetical protein